MPGRHEIGLQDLAQGLGGQLVQRLAAALAHVVDQDVQATAFSQDTGDGGGGGGFVGHVERECVSETAARLSSGAGFFHGHVEAVSVAAIEPDLGPVGGERTGHGQAQATAGAGDQGHAALQGEEGG
ncbi:hypothetical protein FQZ97_775450 [compost metagenome]